MLRTVAATLGTGLLLTACALPTAGDGDRSPSATGSLGGTLPEPGYVELPADRFRDPAGTGHAFASADGVVECTVRPTDAGTAGECVSWRPGRSGESLIVFGETGAGDTDGFSADVSPARPPRWGNDFPRLSPGELIRLGAVTCLSPAEGSISCFSVRTDEGFRLTDDRYDTFHQGGERFGL